MGEPFRQVAASLRSAQRLGHASHVAPHVAERARVDRHHLGSSPDPLAQRLLHVGEAGSAHLALVLGEDHAGRQLAQAFGVDAIDGETVAHELLHPVVDLPAGAARVELGGGERGQVADRVGVIALVGASHQALLEAKRTGDLGGARQQRGDAFHRSPDCMLSEAGEEARR